MSKARRVIALSAALAVAGWILWTLLGADGSEGRPLPEPPELAPHAAAPARAPVRHESAEPPTAAAELLEPAPPEDSLFPGEVRFVMVPCSDHPSSTWTLTLRDDAGREVDQRALHADGSASFHELDETARYGVTITRPGSWLGHGTLSGASAQHALRCAALFHIRGTLRGADDPTTVAIRVEAPSAPELDIAADGSFRVGPVSPSRVTWLSGDSFETREVRFQPGQLEAQVVLDHTAPPQLHGRVVDRHGRPSEAQVYAASRTGGTSRVRTDRDGMFQLDDFKRFPVDVWARDGAQLSALHVVTDGDEALEIALGDAPRIRGTIVSEDGSPYTNGVVTASVARDGQRAFQLDVSRQADGAFDVGPFPPGAQVVFTDMRTPGWSVSLTAGARDAQIVVPRAQAMTLVVEVSSTEPAVAYTPDDAQLFVAAGEPGSGSGVLFPIRATRLPDGTGSATIQVPPGQAGQLTVELRQPGWTAARAPVELDTSGGEPRLRAHIRTAPVGPCSLRVLGPEGHLVETGEARLTRSQEPDLTTWLTGGRTATLPIEQGHVVIEREIGDEAEVLLSAPGFFPERLQLSAPPPRSLDVLLTPVPDLAF